MSLEDNAEAPQAKVSPKPRQTHPMLRFKRINDPSYKNGANPSIGKGQDPTERPAETPDDDSLPADSPAEFAEELLELEDNIPDAPESDDPPDEDASVHWTIIAAVVIVVLCLAVALLRPWPKPKAKRVIHLPKAPAKVFKTKPDVPSFWEEHMVTVLLVIASLPVLSYLVTGNVIPSWFRSTPPAKTGISKSFQTVKDFHRGENAKYLYGGLVAVGTGAFAFKQCKATAPAPQPAPGLKLISRLDKASISPAPNSQAKSVSAPKPTPSTDASEAQQQSEPDVPRRNLNLWCPEQSIAWQRKLQSRFSKEVVEALTYAIMSDELHKLKFGLGNQLCRNCAKCKYDEDTMTIVCNVSGQYSAVEKMTKEIQERILDELERELENNLEHYMKQNRHML